MRMMEEEKMVDTKKEQERDELEQSMVGISKTMFLVRCFIGIFPKTCVVT